MAIQELFYNPYTKQSGKSGILKGRVVPGLQMDAHDNHLHVASDNSEEIRKVMDKANQMGFTVHENPYATKKGWDKDGVQHVHSNGSYHYQTFSDGTGSAVDITGDPNKLMEFIDNFIYGEITKKPAPKEALKADPTKPGESGNSSLTSKSDDSNVFKSLFTNVLKSTGLGDTFKEGVESVMLESFQNPVTSSRVSSGVFGDRKTYKYNLITDETVVAPYNGKIVKIDNNSGKYKVVISHTYNNKKLKSIISGLDSINVHQNETVSAGHTIGRALKNSVVSWSVYDNASNQQDIKQLITVDDKKSTKGKDKNNYGDNDSFFKSWVKLTNPVALTISGVKTLANQDKDEEETTTTESLQEEIKRIKQLLK